MAIEQFLDQVFKDPKVKYHLQQVSVPRWQLVV